MSAYIFAYYCMCGHVYGELADYTEVPNNLVSILFINDVYNIFLCHHVGREFVVGNLFSFHLINANLLMVDRGRVYIDTHTGMQDVS